jgi:hypothetical protein
MKLRELAANTMYWTIFLGGTYYLVSERGLNIILALVISFGVGSLAAILTMVFFSIWDR